MSTTSMNQLDARRLARRVRVARGEEPGDVLLRGGRAVNVFTREVVRADVVISDGWIAGVGEYDWDAKEVIDVAGGLVCPGLIDGHMHIESTLLTPAQLAKVLVPRGTLAIIADPHEIGNVLGARGVRMMLDASDGLALDCFIMAPSCVPASPFERAGAVIEEPEIAELLKHPRVLGLAEMMNFPGVVAGDESVLGKVATALSHGGIVDGHSPGLLGRDLVAYACAGITSDHECSTLDEARQRAALGMTVLVREGSMARNLDAMLPAILDGELGEWCLCTDDVHAEDLMNDGHLDCLLKRLVAAGLSVADAVRHASFTTARHFGLRDRGAVAPGYRAGLTVFGDARDFEAMLVVQHGEIVVRDGEMTAGTEPPRMSDENTVHLPADLGAQMFRLKLGEGRGTAEADVIGVIPDQIVTTRERCAVNTDADGCWTFDPAADVALIACVQRHRPTGDAGVALVRGFGFTSRGALASSVGHDAHNILVAGTDESDMAAAVKALESMGGGFVCVADGAVKGQMPLPVAGLLSQAPAPDVVRQQRAVTDAARSLGCTLHSPFGTLSFLGLSVIPALKVTDMGLFDVESFSLVKA